MTQIENKLDALLQNASFRTVSGTLVLDSDLLPASGKSTVNVELDCPANVKLVMFQADDTTVAAVKGTTGTMYVLGLTYSAATPVVTNNSGKNMATAKLWLEYIVQDENYGWIISNGDSAVDVSGDKFMFKAYALKAGTYNWTAYYWDE